jgi:preprotein translocase subunit SecF
MKQTKSNPGWGRFDFLGISAPITIGTILLVIATAGWISVKGFNYGVDFAGGIEVQIGFNQPVEAGRVRAFTEKVGFKNANVQALGDGKEYLIHMELPEGKSDTEMNLFITSTMAKLKTDLAAEFPNEGADVRRQDTVGPQVGAELKRNGILAAFYCFLLILVYIGLRFDYRYAPAAVFCLFHDAVITAGLYSLFGWEFTVQTLAALLTIVGYSLNDTIVIFDRIRENQEIHRDKPLYWVANLSINETLSRTILTFFCTLITVVAMYILADGAIQDFARAMMIGMFLGVYSTVYVATPLMLWIDSYQKWRRQRVQGAAFSGGK